MNYPQADGGASSKATAATVTIEERKEPEAADGDADGEDEESSYYDEEEESEQEEAAAGEGEEAKKQEGRQDVIEVSAKDPNPKPQVIDLSGNYDADKLREIEAQKLAKHAMKANEDKKFDESALFIQMKAEWAELQQNPSSIDDQITR